MTTDQLRTNRDLYLFVSELVAKQKTSERDLETYLTALWQLGAAHRTSSAVPLATFAGMLEEAFAVPVPEGVALSRPDKVEKVVGYLKWEQMIISQILDMRGMRAAGVFENEQRYFGTRAPGCGYWYNFDPLTYLECAIAGSFGGWQEGDDTGRQLVPGKVAVIGADGRMAAVDPSEIENPVVELGEVRWDDLYEFLWAGQYYE